MSEYEPVDSFPHQYQPPKPGVTDLDLLPPDLDLDGLADIPPGPELRRMHSGDHFSPVQFRDHIQVVQPAPGEIPAVHRNPLAWYGGETEDGGRDAER